MLPTTLSGLMIFVFAMIPGLPGESIYKLLIGAHWQEKEWWSILRIIGFSTTSLVLYIIIANIFNFPMPIYIFPNVFSHTVFTVNSILPLSISYMGHIFMSIIVGCIASYGRRCLSRWFFLPVYPSAWDEFVRSSVPGHWVVVTLDNGDVYAGKLETANINIEETNRDIILEEPALYTDQCKYVASSYQYLFLSGSMISSIAAVSNSKDSRSTKIGDSIF